MQKKKGFIPYDWFKLIVAILLVVAIFFVWRSTTCCGEPPPVEKPVTEEVAETEPEPTEEAETESEDTDTAADADVELPPLPEASDGLEYDAAKGGLVDADGNLVYTLNEDGQGWTPLIPDEMASMQLEGQWTLLDENGNPAYTWDAESRAWVAVPQEESAEEVATNIVDCPGAAEPRLVGGQQAEALRDVNFRSSPGVSENWIGSLFAGDQVTVMGDTACTPYGSGAYLWWQVERADGSTGWVAEAKVNSPTYFLAPVE